MKLPIFILAMIAALAVCAHAQEVGVSATLENQTTTVGVPVQLDIRISGLRVAIEPPQISVEGLDIRYRSSSTQMQIINGDARSAIVHSYIVTAGRNGTFTIPPVEVVVQGQRFRTAALALKVEPGGAEQQVKVASAEIVVPKKSVYVGEAIPVELRLYVIHGVNFQLETLPQFEGEGFTKTKLRDPRQETVQRDGRAQNVIIFRTAVTPGKAGKITLGPCDFTFLAQVPRARRKNENPSTDFFDRMLGMTEFSETQRMTAKAEAVELEVKPLPAAGRPKDFSGAVGNFQFAAEGTPQDVKIGDPVSMKLRVSGRGNFDRIEAPAMLDAEGWRSYPPSNSFRAEDDIGVSGTKTFEMSVVPEVRKSAMPQFSFSYFDPTAEKYVTLTSARTPLVVRGDAPPKPVPVPAADEANPPPAATPAPADILGQRYDFGAKRGTFEPIYTKREFLWAQLVPALVVLGLIVRRMMRRDDRQRALGALRREKAEMLRKLDGKLEDEKFYETVARIIQLDTAIATGRPAESIDAAAACASRTLDAQTAEGVEAIFDSRAALLYAGGEYGGRSSSSTDRDRAMETLQRFEKAHA